jgi:hypothetical protein
MGKSRITNLSTRFLELYKTVILLFLLSILGYHVYRVIQDPPFLPLAAIWVWVIWKFIKINRKVFHVEFDDEFLYLIRKDADVLIPLQNIQSVGLKTMGGLYEIKLYSPEIVGDLIYYKPSLLYPFNFKAKDEIANQLRDNIEKAKAKPEVFQKNALMS